MNTATTTAQVQPGQEAAALISAALERPDLSGPKVARESKLSTSTIYNYRDGLFVPRERDCERLAKSLGIEESALTAACDRDRAVRRKLAAGGVA